MTKAPALTKKFSPLLIPFSKTVEANKDLYRCPAVHPTIRKKRKLHLSKDIAHIKKTKSTMVPGKHDMMTGVIEIDDLHEEEATMTTTEEVGATGEIVAEVVVIEVDVEEDAVIEVLVKQETQSTTIPFTVSTTCKTRSSISKFYKSSTLHTTSSLTSMSSETSH